MNSAIQRQGAGVRQALLKTWIDLAREKGVHGVTVRNLCLRTPASRSSFYEQFSNLEELQQTVCESFFQDLLSKDAAGGFRNDAEFSRKPVDYEHLFYRIFQCLDRNRELLQLLLVEQPDPVFSDRWCLLIECRLRQRYPDSHSGFSFALIQNSIPEALLTYYRNWLGSPFCQTRECAKTMARLVGHLDAFFQDSL